MNREDRNTCMVSSVDKFSKVSSVRVAHIKLSSKLTFENVLYLFICMYTHTLSNMSSLFKPMQTLNIEPMQILE